MSIHRFVPMCNMQIESFIHTALTIMCLVSINHKKESSPVSLVQRCLYSFIQKESSLVSLVQRCLYSFIQKESSTVYLVQRCLHQSCITKRVIPIESNLEMSPSNIFQVASVVSLSEYADRKTPSRAHFSLGIESFLTISLQFFPGSTSNFNQQATISSF